MIRIYAPAIDPRDLGKGQTRVGANILIEDSEYVLCIDGRCGAAAGRVVKRLNARDKKKVLLASHPHYDHIFGIEKDIDAYGDAEALICPDPASLNKKYSAEAKGNVEALERIIAKAKKKGIKVIYAKDGQKFRYGAIEFTTYRDQPSSAKDTETYINAGSICVWFPAIRLLYTGDAGADCAIEHGLTPAVITGMHHGNWLKQAHADWLENHGCEYYWDDDYSTGITQFLSTGRGNAKDAGMTILTLHGDLNICCFGGKANVYKGGEVYHYKCSYDGKPTFRGANLTVVADVLGGEYGGGDERVTELLDNGYNVGSVQGWVNKMFRLIKG